MSKGSIYYENGLKYEGDQVNGEPQGKEVDYWEDGTVWYVGGV